MTQVNNTLSQYYSSPYYTNVQLQEMWKYQTAQISVDGEEGNKGEDSNKGNPPQESENRVELGKYEEVDFAKPCRGKAKVIFV